MFIALTGDVDEPPGNAASSYSASSIATVPKSADRFGNFANNNNNTGNLVFSTTNHATTTTTTTNLGDFQQEATIRNGLLFLKGLRSNLAESMDQCANALQQSGLHVNPISTDSSKWCSATWDTVLCWPATPANSSITLQCPPLKGLDPTKNITKFCHASGRWMGKLDGDFSRSHGWTNFTMCFTEEVVYIMKNLNNGSLGIAQDVAQNTRKLEFVGLGLSLISLLLSIVIFSCFRRLRVFRNLLHLQLMIAILMVVIIRLVLYIDLIFTDRLGHVLVNPEGKTINTMVIVCESAFFLLEYFKSVAFWWMFLEGFYLHNQLVLTVFNTEPKLWPYLITGYGVPLIHTIIWLLVIVYKKQGKVERCLGSYYLEPEFWILDGPRMLQLVVNTFFISNVIRVLWTKVRDVGNTGEVNRMKKSVKAALMLIPLLGIPNIMQTIPFSPTHENITYFAIWTYCASFTYMYQGLIIAIIYCFTNREVQAAMKNVYYRYRLQHTNTADLRRGSRSLPSYCLRGGGGGGTSITAAAAVGDSTNNNNHNNNNDGDSEHNNNSKPMNGDSLRNGGGKYYDGRVVAEKTVAGVVRSSSNANGSDTTGYDTGGDCTYRRESSTIANDLSSAKFLMHSTDEPNVAVGARNVDEFGDGSPANDERQIQPEYDSASDSFRSGARYERVASHPDDGVGEDGDDEATPFALDADEEGADGSESPLAAYLAHVGATLDLRQTNGIPRFSQRS